MTAENAPGTAGPAVTESADVPELPLALIEGARPAERIDLDGITVRRHTLGDLAALHTAIADSREHLSRWMPWAAGPAKIEDQEDFLRHAREQWDAGTTFNYGVFDTAGTLVAGIGMHPRRGPHCIEIGYWAHVAHTGRGHITRASAALTREAFAISGIDWVEIHCDAANTASAAVPRRLGFRLDRVIEDRKIEAPDETGQGMVWILDRAAFPGSAADLVR